MIKKNINIEIYDDFNLIEKEWISFQKICHRFSFQTFDWVYTWYSTIGLAQEVEIKIVKVSIEGQILMILPLCLKKQFGGKILTFTDGDYRCGLFVLNFYSLIDKKLFFSVWEAIQIKIKNFDLIYFSLQPKYIGDFSNPFTKYLKSYPYHAKSYQINISKGWNDYKLSISKKLLNDSKRQIKRLKKIGNIKFEIAKNLDEARIFTNKMILQKSSQYARTGVDNQFDNKGYKNFYFELNKYAFYKKLIHLSSLKVDSEIIAVHWGIIDKKNRTLYYLMPSNDFANWSKYSPGRILMIYLLKWCEKNSIVFFDLTSGNEKYKKSWANHHADVMNYLSAKTVKGLLLKIVLKARHKYKNYKSN